MLRARELGGESWLHYTPTQAELQTVSDKIMLLLKTTAQRKARLTESEQVERPPITKKPTRRIAARDPEAQARFLAGLM